MSKIDLMKNVTKVSKKTYLTSNQKQKGNIFLLQKKKIVPKYEEDDPDIDSEHSDDFQDLDNSIIPFNSNISINYQAQINQMKEDNAYYRKLLEDEKQQCSEYVQKQQENEMYIQDMEYVMSLLTDSQIDSYTYAKKLIEARTTNEQNKILIEQMQKQQQFEEIEEEYNELQLVLESFDRENIFLKNRKHELKKEIQKEVQKSQEYQDFLSTHLFPPPESQNDQMDVDHDPQLIQEAQILEKEISVYKMKTQRIQQEIEKLNQRLAQLGRESDELTKKARNNH